MNTHPEHNIVSIFCFSRWILEREHEHDSICGAMSCCCCSICCRLLPIVLCCSFTYARCYDVFVAHAIQPPNWISIILYFDVVTQYKQTENRTESIEKTVYTWMWMWMCGSDALSNRININVSVYTFKRTKSLHSMRAQRAKSTSIPSEYAIEAHEAK